MDYQIIRRFYSNVEANIYYLRLQEAGISCFLSQENISTILPLSDGGVFVNVAVDQLEEARALMKTIDLEKEKNKNQKDFREATVEDIYYEKEVVEYEKRLNSGWIDNNIVSVFIFMLFFIVIIMIIVNFFYPFII
ncbi:putative signal transducing protein [Portibacter lacus]|uniref:DUF2007 domain-containing protein n=1 Tax=Portibacter lacus TaxID=1099794 RepID=A0AA37WDF1_9BACT|nr:DUF2007 domain-containing protein [Portibacter lacus]GLR16888.1 hypothetical protein GCM10007940_15030 [Portibacter lacus]